ncbi:MAG: ada [Cytophagaceae bacterium]|nr:ada [Cytophagaceae bacterium]
MNKQEEINYSRIAEAIDYIRVHFKEQPSLDEIAAHLHLSPFHFQRLFSDWAGVSPKQFLQFISVGYAKQLLREKQITLFDAAEATGLSGTGRLHDLFVKIEGMTPGEYKNGGEQLAIQYSFQESPFGKLLIASTNKGICLTIPLGALTTYGSIAEHIQNPSASRAVGTAIGSNPVAFLIPCHRVIQGSGVIGGYMWGPTRKTAIIGWEAAQMIRGQKTES